MALAKGAKERSGRSAHRAARPSSAFAQPPAADSVDSRPETTHLPMPTRQPLSSPADAAKPGQWLPGASFLRLACVTGTAATLALLGALTVPSTLLAQQADDIELVSNENFEKLYLLVVHQDYRTVQPFTTGTHQDGYLLSGVSLWPKAVHQEAIPVVTVHQQPSKGAPGPLLYTLTNPATLMASSSNTFTAPANAILQSGHTYSIQVSNSSSEGNFLLGKTLIYRDHGEPGWSIGRRNSRYLSEDGGSTWERYIGVHSMKITGRNNDAVVTASGIRLTSSGYFYTGNIIEASVTFTEAVAVTGMPILAIQIGENSRDATYVSGDGTTELIFRYPVVDDDYDDDGVSILPRSLSLPSGASIKKQGSNEDVLLTLPPLGDKRENAVNSGAEILSKRGVKFTSTPVAQPGPNGYYGLGEAIEATVTFEAPVIVDTTGGTPTFTITIGSYGAGYEPRSAAYVRGSGSAALVFAYVVQSGDWDSDGVSVLADQLELNSGTIRDVAGRDAVLAHRASSGGAGNHKVNGALTLSLATLADLSLSPGTLTPAFDAANTSYTATVANDIEVITVTASAANGAMTSILPADADANTAGHQVSLHEGRNLIAVVVSETGAADRTYTVSVARGGRVLLTTSPTFRVEEHQFFRGEVIAQDFDENDSVSGYEITGGADLQLFMFAPGTSTLEFTDAPDGPNFEPRGMRTSTTCTSWRSRRPASTKRTPPKRRRCRRSR